MAKHEDEWLEESLRCRRNEVAKARLKDRREWIAVMVLQGLASVPSPGGVTDAGIAHDVGAAVAYADALIDALAGKGSA